MKPLLSILLPAIALGADYLTIDTKINIALPQSIYVSTIGTNLTAKVEGESVTVEVSLAKNHANYSRLTFIVATNAWIGPWLATNTVVVSASGDNHVGCVTCAMLSPWKPGMTVVAIPAIHHPWHPDGLPYTEATERWTIDTTIRRETATFKWRGQSTTLTNDTVLGAVTNRWKLKTDWEKAP